MNTINRRTWGQRVLPMTMAWLALGVLIGAMSGLADRSVIGVISGAIAGLVLLPWIGSFLGLLGARVADTLLGGAFGGIVMAAGGGVSGTADPALHMHVGLLAGALTAGLLRPYLRLWGGALSWSYRSATS